MEKRIKEFNKNLTYYREQMPVHARLLDIESEMGELAKEYLKSSSYGAKEFVLSDDFKEEFGDVLYALISLAGELNISCEECVDVVLDKLNTRMQEKNNLGSGR